ncbi:MAG: DUF1844 domain-containing protein [Thermodesulfobacteriota bacterium]|nr:DUF1844 domain-containing protein [Thermodesulfobacteriota bacterium]
MDTLNNDQSHGQQEAEPINFMTLIMGFATAAMIAMGHIPDPVSGALCTDISVAKQNIHIIKLLKIKTQGNLSEEENKAIEDVICDLDGEFVQANRAVSHKSG